MLTSVPPLGGRRRGGGELGRPVAPGQMIVTGPYRAVADGSRALVLERPHAEAAMSGQTAMLACHSGRVNRQHPQHHGDLANLAVEHVVVRLEDAVERNVA